MLAWCDVRPVLISACVDRGEVLQCFASRRSQGSVVVDRFLQLTWGVDWLPGDGSVGSRWMARGGFRGREIVMVIAWPVIWWGRL
eukprot:7781670-Pyramimonas_sp.AAC.1